MVRHLLVVGDQDSSAVKAASLGVDVTLFQLPRLGSPKQIAAACRTLVFDFEALDESLAFAHAVHARQPFDAVISFWELALLPATAVAEALNVPGNPMRPVQLTRDKLAMRNLLHERGIDSVAFRCCNTQAEVSFLAGVEGAIVRNS